MRTAVVSVALLVLGIASGVTASKCLTRSEARTLWPRTHLYWYNDGGHRCWSNRRGKSVVVAERPKPVPPRPPRPPMPPPQPLPPAAIAELMPTLYEGAPVTILDHPRWKWVAEARASAHESDHGPMFSTFAEGTEPDVWPKLAEQPTNPAGMFIIVLSGLFAMMLGFMIWRWQIGRVRITRRR